MTRKISHFLANKFDFGGGFFNFLIFWSELRPLGNASWYKIEFYIFPGLKTLTFLMINS